MDDVDIDQLLGFVVFDNDIFVGCIFFLFLIFDIFIWVVLFFLVVVSIGYQDQGIGQQFIWFGIEYMCKNGMEFIFIYGDLNYYVKVGFNVVFQIMV